MLPDALVYLPVEGYQVLVISDSRYEEFLEAGVKTCAEWLVDDLIAQDCLIGEILSHLLPEHSEGVTDIIEILIQSVEVLVYIQGELICTKMPLQALLYDWLALLVLWDIFSYWEGETEIVGHGPVGHALTTEKS